MVITRTALSMEVSFSCVPITALHVCRVGDQDCLLAGRGPSLCVYSCKRRRALLERRVFASQVIHGISSQLIISTDENTASTHVLLWAGSAASLLRLQTVREGWQEGGRDSPLTANEVCHVAFTDWALFGDFFRPDFASTAKPFLVTAHNEVHEIVDEYPTTGKRIQSCRRLVSGPACMLYAAHARRTPNGLLIAAGAVFGEVVVWAANKDKQSGLWSTNIRNVFLGHEGSIFGVSLSDDNNFDGYQRQLLVTCSDDRTIRLWAVADEVEPPTSIGSHIPNSLELSDVTGFVEDDSNGDYLLGMAWGHLSRVWTVKFLPVVGSHNTRNTRLVSMGEDATARLWEIYHDSQTDEIKHEPIQLRHTATHSIHSGKNIWSSDFHSVDLYNLYTGGADGSIVATRSKDQQDDTTSVLDFVYHTLFADIFYELKTHERAITKRRRVDTGSLKQYAFTGDGFILATTAKSELIHSNLETDHKEILWKHIYTSDIKSPILLCNDQLTGSVFFARAGGNLYAIERGSTRIVPSLITIDPQAAFICVASREKKELSRSQLSPILIPVPHKCSAMLAWVSIGGSVILERRFQLNLPPGFVPTSAGHHVEFDVLLLGSRSGDIAIFSNLRDAQSVEAIKATSIFKIVHHRDTVTSIMVLSAKSLTFPKTAEHSFFALTTGRDGAYAVHKISLFALQRKPTLLTVHNATLPIGPNIEGAYLKTPADITNQELVLFGFKSKDFIVWNETRQIKVLSVDCGGAHRSWAYTPTWDEETGTCLSDTLVWTKAGACNVYRKSSEDHFVVQRGGHGREIKALAVSPVRLSLHGRSIENATLVATGAEDTTIRLFLVAKGSDISTVVASVGREMTCIRVLSKHTTGIHHLEFSSCGKYLFSSGGCEELFVWRLHTNIPVIGIGVVLECMLPKTNIDADARIANFTVRRKRSPGSEANGTDTTFRIMAAYSNGKFKIFSYSGERADCKGAFTLLRETVEGTFCLTQIHDVQSRVVEDVAMLTAGTNGTINIHEHGTRSLVMRHGVHQSSVKASVLLETQNGLLMITGGDDNALGITVISSNAPMSTEETLGYKTLVIPNAHAAAVTGIALISQIATEDVEELFTIASVSNDQRVKVWRVTVRAEDASDLPQKVLKMQQVRVEKVMECWTTVADAAAVQLLSPTPDSERSNEGSEAKVEVAYHELLVVGVGMEIIKVPSATRLQ